MLNAKLSLARRGPSTHETPRVHHAGWRCSGCGAACGASAASREDRSNPRLVHWKSAISALLPCIEQRLRDLGFVEGQNIAFEYRDAEGMVDRLPGLAAEFVRLDVNVICTATDPATRAAKEATTNIPIVMVAINFDRSPLVTSTASLGLERTSLDYSFSTSNC